MEAVEDTPDVDAQDASTPLPTPDAAPRRRLPLWAFLTALGLAAVLFVVAAVWTVSLIYRQFYSPSAFVEHYTELLAEGRAADALAVPGVPVDSADLETAGLPASAHDALLRRDALDTLTDVRVVSEVQDGDLSLVTVTYLAGATPGTSTFVVEREGSIGLAPTWRFAVSPLTVLDVGVTGSRSFEVNGFRVDQRQVSPDGVDADPDAPVSLLAFTPGLYTVAVDTAIAETPGVDVLADSPFSELSASVVAEPTAEFRSVVQQRVEEFLTECATQQVLQPTACPFGFPVDDRVISPPEWSIAEQPVIELSPTGDGWSIPPIVAVARIEVEVRSLFDGAVRKIAEDVPFSVSATIAVLVDGTATITVGGGPPVEP